MEDGVAYYNIQCVLVGTYVPVIVFYYNKYVKAVRVCDIAQKDYR